jgi:hypothetical protein
MAGSTRRVLFTLIVLLLTPSARCGFAADPIGSSVRSLDGGDWRIAIDPQNEGRAAHWFTAPLGEAKATKVPWIIQDAFPTYHGVAWYWREFSAPLNPHAGGRYLLRFWAVDYLAEVWLNGESVGAHEGGETPFVLDVTEALKPGMSNLLAVRVLNPAHERIDGIVLRETPQQARVVPYSAGAAYNHGGVTGSVELLVVPVVRVEDLFAHGDPATGVIRIRATVVNTGPTPVRGEVSFSVAPAASGETLQVNAVGNTFPPGETPMMTELALQQPKLWELNEPTLYRVTARVMTDEPRSGHEHSVRCGFRDFRFEGGYFRLNGRRLLLRSTHTCNHFPVGLKLPPDPDMARRDLLDLKAMGFNMIRFIWGGAERYQLDLCDEIGLMVYEESFASSAMQESPQQSTRWNQAVLQLIRRDRNHPSVVIWGLLNEIRDSAQFRLAASSLSALRQLDDTRMVFLNSGRWDLAGNADGVFARLEIWHAPADREPWVTLNPSDTPVETPFSFIWPPRQVALHPGPRGEYSVARWTAPAADRYAVEASFQGLANATTDVHVLHNGQPLFTSQLNLQQNPNWARHAAELALGVGDTLDFVVGWGNGSYGSDSTSLNVTIKSGAGRTFDVAADFSGTTNPVGPWSYGFLAAGAKPDVMTFSRYSASGKKAQPALGSLANPGSREWENVVTDQHNYPRVPHTADTIRGLRTLAGAGTPLFLSEYGIGSAVDLCRVTRHFERLGKTEVEDARFYRDKLDRYLADWTRWRLDELYARPEDFFAESLRKMAGQRTLGINAIRSNPNIVGYSLTGMNDHVSCGEGLTTTFRELKPGTVDAIFEGFAPLRMCLFVEPANVNHGTRVRLEAVLANEDALAPGEYPMRLLVAGPGQQRIFEQTVNVTVGQDMPFALPVFAEDIVVDGPPGRYRFLASFERGGAATGGETEFFVADPADLPAVKAEIVLASDDAELAAWLAAHGVRCRTWTESQPTQDQVILVSQAPAVFAELWKRVEDGATAVFLLPAALQKGDQPLGWLPLANQGTAAPIHGWLYLKDEWAKRHPVFDGLPSGGLLDYTFYREIIPDLVLTGQDPPAEAVAGAIKASQDYSSGLMLAVHKFGAGRIILNTLRIRENLGAHPAADRLLLNLLRYGANESRCTLHTSQQ